MLLAFVLAGLTLSHRVQVFHVFILAAVLGLVNAFDIPARQAFVVDMVGKEDLKDTISRLQAYQNAGARVLYVPGLRTKEDIAAVVSSVDRPVNVLMGLAGVNFTLAELSAMGVKRVSVGSALSRAALGGFLRAAREITEHGTFTFADDAVSYADISAMLAE